MIGYGLEITEYVIINHFTFQKKIFPLKGNETVKKYTEK
jgi:hypothetical protein